MSAYLLYGTKTIESDKTLNDFARSVVNSVPVCDMVSNKSSVEDYRDEFMDIVHIIVYEDVSRTDIDYESLMFRYRKDLGYLLYDIENHGRDTPDVSFWGDAAEDCFNSLICSYIDIHFDELTK